MPIAAISNYVIDAETPAVEQAAWVMVEGAARKGLFDQVRTGQVSTLDLRLAREFIESRGAVMQIPPDHREMYGKLIGEAERYLRQHPKLDRPTTLSGTDGMAGIFDAIWSGIKAVGGAVYAGGKAVVNVAGKVFNAGQTVQANATAINAKAGEIAASVAQTVKTANTITSAVSSGVAQAQVDSIATGFFKSDTGKLVMIGGGVVVLLLLLGGRKQGKGR
jgi:hypothetical protein